MADRRFADAEALRRTGLNVHANGAMYLAGISLELVLKALLLKKHCWLSAPFGDPAERTSEERSLFELCYVKHDLGGLLDALEELRKKLAAVDGGRLLQSIKRLAAEWSIHIRYSTRQSTIAEATDYIERFRELRGFLI